MAKGLGFNDVQVRMINKMQLDIDALFGIAKTSVHMEPMFDPEDTTYLDRFSREEKISFIRDVVFGSRHYGVFDHLFYTFEIYGVSRSMTHQAVRNRIAAFLESSLRYINISKKGLTYVVPKSIVGHPELVKKYNDHMTILEEMNKEWYDIGINLGIGKSEANELARTVLPHATATGYKFSMSLSSLLRLFEKRCCVRTETEFRIIAGLLANIMEKELPWMFDKIGAHCDMYGMCPEGERSCGRVPRYDEPKYKVVEIYEELDLTSPEPAKVKERRIEPIIYQKKGSKNS